MTPITLSIARAIRPEADDRLAAPTSAAPAIPTLPMTVLVADAEQGARVRLGSLLRGSPDIERVLECGSGAEAVDIIQARRPDLAFLEVRLPALGGFEVIQAVGPAGMPPVVFLAASREYASRAFEVDALDYLVKPFDDGRCLATLERARRRLGAGAAAVIDRPLRGLVEPRRPAEVMDRIAVKLRGRMVIVQVEGIDWLEARDNYVRLHVGSAHYLVRGKISALERRLDPRRFLRVHRGALVNVDRIVEVRSGLRGETVILSTGVQLPVGSTRRDDLLQRLGFSAGD